MIKEVIYSKRMLIRDLENNDFNFINSFYNDYSFYKYAIGPSMEMTKEKFNSIIKNNTSHINNFYCVSKLIDKDIYIGTIKGCVYNCNNKILWIHSIMISKDYLKKGYAKELFESIVNYFKLKLNIEWIYISVSEKNDTGAIFWQRQGFAEFKTINGERNLLVLTMNLEEITIYRKSCSINIKNI